MNRSIVKNGSRILLGAGLVFAGISHLSFARKAFKAQVPDWVPLKEEDTVLYSGIAEIALGTALVVAPKRHRGLTGKIAALFFAAVFPGNIAQYTHHRDAFGLDTDAKRFTRLWFQPLLIAWALKSTAQKRCP
ncbi:DoxX family protein [Taibaiella chishuiensis]|uniref:Putative membrane protein n=1 Tax=Taibaiella chishuiensis TaxID=1434707 RepID=A0A2P8D8E6_9BACT|nr:hypothetical protein [Taibaiella chishuiensis]PSK93483.1 putative membrane protein [Taibaiella chishuiensis]